MRLFPLVILFIRLVTVTAESQKASFERVIIYSCQSALSKYKFDCQAPGFYDCGCSYAPLFGSVAACIDHYSKDPKKRDLAIKGLVDFCDHNAKVKWDIDTVEHVVQNSSKFIQDSNHDGFDPEEMKYVPVLPLETELNQSLRDYEAFLGNFDISQVYGVYINYYWLVVLVWLGIWNRLKTKRFINKVVGRSINTIRSKITLSLLGNTHFQPFRFAFNLTSLLPSGLEAFILGIYFFIHTVYLFKNLDIYKENLIFGSNLISQFIRYISDRSGVLSFAHLPIIILFAGRNNMLIKLAKIPYSSFMIFHKWTARIMFVDALIHTLGYYEIIMERGTLFKAFTKAYVVWGTVAIVLGIALLIQAIHNFRVKNYEMFLVLHIVFAIGFLITCWKHVETFGWKEWIYGATAIWVVDRSLRIYKLWKFGVPKAHFKFISDETFKISVRRPHNWVPFPGCFVYIHFLHWSMFWQSHPFTIVDSILNDEEITIYIKAKDGATLKILDMIDGTDFEMRVSIEGPYGNQSPLEQYQNVLLFAGGNGIPGPFYHALHLCKTPLISKQRIRLVWVIRKVESLQWFEEELTRMIKFDIECDIYITRDFNLELVKLIPLTKKFHSFIRFHSGRANFNKILDDEFLNSQGSIGIVTCGPPIMCDDIRSFTAANLQKCPYRVDIFEELQVW